MANGRRFPIFKSSGTLEAVLLSARIVLHIKSSSALSPPPLQKNPNLQPVTGPLNPQPLILTRQISLLPTTRERKLPETRPHPLVLPPSKLEAMTLKPQEISTPHPHTGQDLKQTQASSKRGSGTRGPYLGSCAFLNF